MLDAFDNGLLTIVVDALSFFEIGCDDCHNLGIFTFRKFFVTFRILK